MPPTAEKMMENILTAQQNKIDGVIASNDGTALGELQAMKAQGLAGKVPISGQDATADGCNSIVKGEQTVSVYKDIRLLSPMAVDMIDKLLKGTAIDGLKEFTPGRTHRRQHQDRRHSGQLPAGSAGHQG